MTADHALRDAAQTAKSWPFEEARKLVKRVARTGKKEVLFETGYGPSGLPHIGTFGEVARTTMVRRAFELLCDIPARLLCFSDDMDGMRKIPENVPDRSFLDHSSGHFRLPIRAISRLKTGVSDANQPSSANNSSIVVDRSSRFSSCLMSYRPEQLTFI